MLDVMHGAPEAILWKRRFKQLPHALPFAPVAKALKYQGRIRAPASEISNLAPKIGTVVLIKREMIDVLKANSGFAKTIGNGLRGEARPMLDAPEPLFLGRGDQLAVANEASGTVTVECVQPENDHR